MVLWAFLLSRKELPWHSAKEKKVNLISIWLSLMSGYYDNTRAAFTDQGIGDWTLIKTYLNIAKSHLPGINLANFNAIYEFARAI